MRAAARRCEPSATAALRGLAAVTLAAALPAAPAAAITCGHRVEDGRSYIVCTVDAARESLELFGSDAAGRPFATFDRLAATLSGAHRRLVFAINAGMYRLDLSPVGLFVADGETRHPAATGEGAGNFYLKPNDVFFFGAGQTGMQTGVQAGIRAGILETSAFLAAGLRPAFATQSGPMLVSAGRLHPSLRPDGTSLKIRNGVGVRDGHLVTFVLSEEPVSFHRFATLFRDALHCPDALYLDGTVSAVYAPALKLDGQTWPLGPMLGVSEPAP